jgi:2-dehydropantoate 2-reductase
MSFQKIFILGAGAIGSCYGALLSRKNDVTLIGNKAHVDAVNSHGLTIKGEIEGKFPVKAETRITEVPLNSLIVLTTKAQDSVKAVTELKPLLRKDTIIFVLQNGLRMKELIQEAVGHKAEVARGLILMAAEFLEPGQITFWNGATIIERTESGDKIRALLQKSGIKTKVSENMETEEWSKMVVNCVINPLTAVLGVRNNEIGVASLRRVRRGLVEECSVVAKAEGIHFKLGLESEIDHKISSYTNYSSMCQDIMKGKKTEISFLNGKIVEFGKKHGIATPVNETMVGLIRFLEAKK